jgi:hypothetical protein
LTSAATIITPFIQQYEWGGGVISAFNACVFFLISLILYLKLESSAELFIHLANQYDKLETSMEVANNRLLFIENETEYNRLVLVQLQDFEKQLNEVKDSNNILVPPAVRAIFPIVSYINIFAFIKRVETYKKNLIVKLRDVKNEIRYILHKWKGVSVESMNDEDKMYRKKEHNRLIFLYDVKDKIKSEFFYYKNAYSYMDILFSHEIKQADYNKTRWFSVNKPELTKTENPIVDEYLKLVF